MILSMNHHFKLRSLISLVTTRKCSTTINPIAQVAFGSDKNVAIHYDNSRPNYSPNTIDKVSEIINMNNLKYNQKPLQIVEVATGTGKFTKSFMKYEKIDTDNQNYYITTEPSETFLSQLNIDKLQSTKWKMEKFYCTSDKLHMVKSESTNALLAAQSFHWMDNINTLQEFHRVLKPNCPIIFVWNSFDMRIDYIRQIENIIDKVYKKIEAKTGELVPRYRTMIWEDVFKKNETKKYFKPLQKWQDIQIYKFTQENVINHCSSISVISSSSDNDKREILDEIKYVLNTHDMTKGKKIFDFQYNIDIAYALRIQ